MNAKGMRQLAQRLRVPLGFFVIPAFLIFARPTPLTLVSGAFVAVSGILLRAWASGHLRKMAELTTSGPYAYTRNPLYLGTFLMVVGIAIAGGSLWLAIGISAAYLAIYVPVMMAEIETMQTLFPDSYDAWAAQVPLFVPRLTPARVSDGPSNRFDSRLFLTYREYRASVGLVAVLLVLTAKMFFQE